MFDFSKWRAFIGAKAAVLRDEGFEVRFSASSDNVPKPKLILELLGDRAYGGFENWITGETDYTVLAMPPVGAKPLAHEWGIVATDENFESTFNAFLAHFRKHASGPKAN
jgi:hypothetical protein